MTRMSAPIQNQDENKSPLAEIVQPFIDLMHAPRALWGINLAYVLEGMVYFGMLGYLAIHFSDFIFQAVDGSDESSHNMVMVLTAGITISMFFLGTVADKKGVRFALLAAFVLLLGGRLFISGAPTVLGLEPTRPGVLSGDKVDLLVSKLETRKGVKSITASTVLANEAAADDGTGLGPFALDLSAGEGTEPSAELQGRLVTLRGVTLLAGKEQQWTVSYGSKPAKAELVLHATKQLGLCKGARLNIKQAYITPWTRDKAEDLIKDKGKEGEGEKAEAKGKGEGKEEAFGYVVRSHWADEITGLDRSGCKEPPKQDLDEDAEATLRVTKREPPAGAQAGAGAKPTTIAQLNKAKDGETSLLLSGASVTYVRNGGYYVQATVGGPAIFVYVDPVGSTLHLLTMFGILLVVIGYGMYQPAAYAAVRQFTTPKTAAMGFAMLYALMNLGGWLPSFAFLLRDNDFLGFGITGTFWVYTGFTALALFLTVLILTRDTVKTAIAKDKAATEKIKAAEAKEKEGKEEKAEEPLTQEKPAIPPVHMWVFMVGVVIAILWRVSAPYNYIVAGVVAAAWVALALIPPTGRWISRHPLANSRFFFFIFALIPVQTLFTYNWLILPQYIKRVFDGWIGEYFEIAANANPILIFIAVPMITALTQKAKVYNMMIIGTLVMAAPAFLLAIGPYPWTLFTYILIMTIGEAMWQPRFLQYAAKIAPKGRTGEYMGVAQLPWFLTKMLVPWLYSGWMMDRYCPAQGPKDTETMWLIFACIAMTSTVMLVVAKGWVGKDFKTSSGE